MEPKVPAIQFCPAPVSTSQPIHLLESDKAALVRLCVARRMEYSLKKGTKTPFWNKIRALLRMEIGKELKYPHATLGQLADERRVVVDAQRKESGTVQRDTEIDQNLDIWIEREDELQREREDAQKPKSVLEQESAQATMHCDNLLVPRSQKRTLNEMLDPTDTQDSDAGSITTIVDSPQPEPKNQYREDRQTERQNTLAIRSVRKMQKRMRKETQADRDAAKDDKIVGAFNNMGTVIAAALSALGESSQAAPNPIVEGHVLDAEDSASRVLEAVEGLSTRLDALEKVVTTGNIETRDMLRLILAQLAASKRDEDS